MSKGSRREKQAYDLLKQAGYAPFKPDNHAFGENDLWSLFDIVAIAPHMPLRAVQVKSNRADGVRAWMRHTALWRRHGFLTEYWVCHDHEGWRVIRGDSAGSETVYDGRGMNASMGDTLVQWMQDEAAEVEA